MSITLNFLGAAQNVTGSSFLVEADGVRFLVDCGMYQERKLVDRNWEPFPVPPRKIDAVLLTHAHLDHCGLLPKLVREGFRGKIWCTPATSEIAKIVLMDSAKLQEEDAEFKRKRHQREGRTGPHPERPLYTEADVDRCARRFKRLDYDETREIKRGVEATFCNAGHILGASMIKLSVPTDGERRSILFSGDVGRPHTPIVKDPSAVRQADYVVMESTYGDEVHKPESSVGDQLAEVINQTRQAGGNIVIPSFAIERSQELLYRLNQLLVADRIPHLMIFLDSPMAIRVTEVFEKHPELFDREMLEFVNTHASPFDLPNLKMTRMTDESKAINHIKGTVIVIAGSGMCTGGRIKHHLVNNIGRPESTILFVGYQAQGTLGRQILDGAEEVRILGQMCPVRARIAKIGGFSAHADRDELMGWLSGLERPPRGVFLVHGEPVTARRFSDHVHAQTGWPVSVPSYKEQVVLE